MVLQAQKLYPYPFRVENIDDVREYLTKLYTALVEGEVDLTENLEYWGQDYWAFKTITGITNDVVADSKGDTLTLASNAFMTIVGTAATDTITFTPQVKDEDTMASDSALHMATQQSIKAYVDTESGGMTFDGGAADMLNGEARLGIDGGASGSI